ncbi:hypothetical protein PQQ51_06785 [Paraburkholderia xenovorans]|uniref:hypothetical protein n=1 Tax=Paraburkholderia xenovorans TaxID=36873 RepID=UPI0038B94A31
MNACFEPFERRYLEALSREGVDLHTFLNGWRHSVEIDLQQVSNAVLKRDIEGQRTSLHRLSGAVGMVGARSLMEALNRASTRPPESEAGAIEWLVQRARTLMTQLEIEAARHRSTVR